MALFDVIMENPNSKKSKTLITSIGIFWKLLKWTFLVGFISFIGLFIIVITHLPPMGEIENPQLDLSTQIYSADGSLLGNLYKTENRIYARLDEISPHVVSALVATEDRRFFSHNGVDALSLFAVFKDVITFQGARGGSTITMQLARNLYDQVGRERSVIRKMKEMIVGIILEKRFTKDEILQAYLNTTCFFGDSYGIEMASRTLFNKPSKNLELKEAALLVGLLKGPDAYHPIRKPEKAKARRNTVLDQMVKYGYLEFTEGEKLKNEDLGIKFKPGKNPASVAPYFREQVKKFLKEWTKNKGYDIYSDGLKVVTTIDSKMQYYAEKAVEEHLKQLQMTFESEFKRTGIPWKKNPEILDRAVRNSRRYQNSKKAGMSEKEIQVMFNEKVRMRIWTYKGEADTLMSLRDSVAHYLKFLETGFTAMDPWSGEIKTWVGGINYRHFQLDHVADSKRQVGSTFKPFVYAAAFEDGKIKPCDKVLDIPVIIELPDGKIWSPDNSGGGDEGMMNYLEALAKSKNQVTGKVMKLVGPEKVCEIAHRLGITSQLNCVHSLALGTTDLNVLEMVRAYASFVNQGFRVNPFFISRIEDKNGVVLEEFKPYKTAALDPNTAYLMVRMLMNVVNSPYGTASRLRSKYQFDIPAGGKTGTTQDNSDGWYVGFTPDLVAGAWVGCSDRRVRFLSTGYGQGANMALPIWAIFMKYVYADSKITMPRRTFLPPEGFDIPLDCPPLEGDSLTGNDQLPQFDK